MPPSINMLGACDGLDTRNATSGRGCRVRRPAKPGGRPRTTELRGVLDGLFHVLRTGCQWRHLPAAYPPWPTVYGYWRAFIAAGVWDEMLHVLRMAAREAEGREASPSAAIIDSQSVKTTERGGRAAGMPARR